MINNKPASFPQTSAKILLLLSFIVFAFVGCSKPERPEVTVSLVGTLSNDRTLAEGAISVFKSITEEGEPAYIEGQELYNEAQAAFNSLIDQYTIALIQGTDASLESALEDAADKNAQVIEFVEVTLEEYILELEQEQEQLDCEEDGEQTDDCTTAQPVGEFMQQLVLPSAAAPIIAAAGAAMIPSLIDAATALWIDYQEADREQQQQILDLLDGLKWRNFSEIE